MQIDIEEPEVGKDRRHIGVRDIVSLVLLVINFSGLIWGAATMSSSVEALKAAMTKLNIVADNLSTQLATVREDYGARIRLLEFQVHELARRIDEPK